MKDVTYVFNKKFYEYLRGRIHELNKKDLTYTNIKLLNRQLHIYSEAFVFDVELFHKYDKQIEKLKVIVYLNDLINNKPFIEYTAKTTLRVDNNKVVAVNNQLNKIIRHIDKILKEVFTNIDIDSINSLLALLKVTRTSNVLTINNKEYVYEKVIYNLQDKLVLKLMDRNNVEEISMVTLEQLLITNNYKFELKKEVNE